MGSDGRGIKVHKTKICVFFLGGGWRGKWI